MYYNWSEKDGWRIGKDFTLNGFSTSSRFLVGLWKLIHIPCIVKKSIGDGKKLLIYSTRTYHIILWYHPFRRVDFSLHTYRCHHLHCPHWVWLASYGSYIQALLCSIQPCCKRKKKGCRLRVGCWGIGLEVFFFGGGVEPSFTYLYLVESWIIGPSPLVQ